MRLAAPVLVAVTLCTSEAAADDRPFVYAMDAIGPERGEVDGTYVLNVGARPSGAIRFLDPTIGRAGIVQQANAQVGLTDHVAFGAFGLLAANGTSAPVGTGGAYVHFTALRPREARRGPTLGFTVMGLREFDGAYSVSVFADAGVRRGGFEFVTNVQAERRFARGADAMDLVLRLGANYDVLGGTENALRLGVEYVGQDLEDYVEGEEAEGGAVHLLAASLSATLLERRLHLGVAPGLVLRAGDRGFGGRLAVGYTF